MSAVRCTSISKATNEIISLDDSGSEIEESSAIENSFLDNTGDLTEDDNCWDGNVFDMLEVECNEDSSIYEDDIFSSKEKIYPIDSFCAICNKVILKPLQVFSFYRKINGFVLFVGIFMSKGIC